MYPIINKILENEDIKQIQKNLESDEITNVSITGLTDSTKAHIIYALTCRGNKSSIIVCSNVIQANKIMQDLKFFSNLEIIYFPAKNLQYYEIEAQSAEIQNQRMYAIDKILSNEKNIVVTTIDALLVKMQKMDSYKKKDIVLKQESKVDLTNFVKELVELGYEKTESVEGKGQFAVRGGIIDIFTLNNDYPYRIELFGDEVDRISEFDILTGTVIKSKKSVTLFPATHFVTNKDKLEEACNRIEDELQETATFAGLDAFYNIELKK